jgi:predicted DNA-binding transcriptional regulator AlpA
MEDKMQDHYVNDEKAAAFLGMSPQTLRNWRMLRKGPSYTKLGRCIRYEMNELKAYAEERKINPGK